MKGRLHVRRRIRKRRSRLGRARRGNSSIRRVLKWVEQLREESLRWSVSSATRMVIFANECRTGKPKEVIGKKNIGCFNCDQIGHYKNQCKKPAKDGNGKVYALEPATSKPIAQEKGKIVLGGTLQIRGMSVSVLFDTGASHSFIYSCFTTPKQKISNKYKRCQEFQ